MFSLEHFYYGQLVHHGRPAGEMRVLARSTGIEDEYVSSIIRTLLLAPDESIPQGTWAIVRGESKDVAFVMIQAQKGKAGQTTHHFILLPREAIATTAGNLKSLLTFVPDELPVFEMLGEKMPPLTLPKPEALTTEAQVDSLLDLMTNTRNNTRTIEPLLSAVVRNTPLIVQNAPADLHDRVSFIQGLLALLPASTRFNTTFATYLRPDSGVRVRVAFMDEAVSDEAVIYDWAAGKVSGAESKDDYSRYIVSQLRLDAELVIQQTEALTNTAGWRFRSGDSLADALAYASNRQKIDNALLQNQPVEVAEVSKILADDPTLDDRLRRVYAEHLIKFSLATDDMQHTDPVAITINRYPDLADGIHRLMNDAVQEGRGALIFETLRRWLDNPLSPQGPQWVALLHASALAELDELVAAKDVASIIEWLNDIIHLDTTMGIDRISRRIVDSILPLIGGHPELPGRLLLLALTHMEHKEAQKLMVSATFARYLPAPIKRFLGLLNRPQTANLEGALLQAAEALGKEGTDTVILMFAEMAYNAERYPLLDTPTLEALVGIAGTPAGQREMALLVMIARKIQEDWLPTLHDPAPRCVLQLLLAGGRYEMLVKAMSDQARDVYGIDRQTDYLRSVYSVFAWNRLSAANATQVLETLQNDGLFGAALWAATAGVLEAAGWSAELKSLADNLLADIRSQPEMLELLPVEIAFSLLQFYHTVHDETGLKTAARLVPVGAAHLDDKAGLSIISQSFKLLRTEKSHGRIGFDLIRQYIRRADDRPAGRVVAFYGKELGAEAAERLENAYQLSRFLGRMDFAEYGEALNVTAGMLQNAAETYARKAEKPSLKRLQSLCDNLRIRTDEKYRRQFGEALREMAKALVALGKQHDSAGSSGAKTLEALIKGTVAPKTGVEVMRFIGGHLGRGRAFPLKMAAGSASTNPLGDILPEALRVDVLEAAHLLLSAANGSASVKWSPQPLTTELDSVMTTINLPVEEGRNLLRQMAVDFQRLSELIPMIYKEGDASAAEDDSRLGKRLDSGQQEPRSVLEFLRFMSGYFLAQQ